MEWNEQQTQRDKSLSLMAGIVKLRTEGALKSNLEKLDFMPAI